MENETVRVGGGNKTGASAMIKIGSFEILFSLLWMSALFDFSQHFIKM